MIKVKVEGQTGCHIWYMGMYVCDRYSIYIFCKDKGVPYLCKMS